MLAVVVLEEGHQSASELGILVERHIRSFFAYLNVCQRLLKRLARSTG